MCSEKSVANNSELNTLNKANLALPFLHPTCPIALLEAVVLHAIRCPSVRVPALASFLNTSLLQIPEISNFLCMPLFGIILH